jgi:hypothetical protein
MVMRRPSAIQRRQVNITRDEVRAAIAKLERGIVLLEASDPATVIARNDSRIGVTAFDRKI